MKFGLPYISCIWDHAASVVGSSAFGSNSTLSSMKLRQWHMWLIIKKKTVFHCLLHGCSRGRAAMKQRIKHRPLLILLSISYTKIWASLNIVHSSTLRWMRPLLKQHGPTCNWCLSCYQLSKKSRLQPSVAMCLKFVLHLAS